MSVGTGGARQAHAAIPDPRERHIVVANQNGKVLERIDTDYSTNTFTHVVAASLDLANCTTPNGVACQLAGVRPDNAPICPIIDDDGRFTFVTLRGGGLFVVDANQTPMRIVGEYDITNVHGNGCGGVQTHNRMWIDSGGALAANLTEFDVYRFPVTGYSASNPPNTPAREVIFSDDNAAFDRDAHGMVTTFFGMHVWVYDRAANRAEVFRASDGNHLNTVPLAHSSATDPTPDLSDRGPWWTGRQFISLRGPTPLTGDPHVATGSTPGLGIMQMDFFGVGGQLIAILPIHNIDADNVERADGHGVRTRRL